MTRCSQSEPGQRLEATFLPWWRIWSAREAWTPALGPGLSTGAQL